MYDILIIMDLYCVKCRKLTPTIDPIETIAKNNKIAISGKCEICGIKKYKFGKLASFLKQKTRR